MSCSRWCANFVRRSNSWVRSAASLPPNQVNALFLNLGVRDEAELRSRLEVTRSGENLTVEESFETAMELLEMVFVSAAVTSAACP
jgi:glutamine synthetase type III